MPDVTLLAVDPDVRVLELIRRVADRSQYRLVAACHAENARRLVRSERPDVIVLRLGLRDGEGGLLARDLRREAGEGVPILLLRAGEEDAAPALDLGGVSVLSFPFTEAEFAARLGGLLRWARRPVDEGVLNVGPVSVDLERGELLRPHPQPLTGSELVILRRLLSPPGRPLSADEIPAGGERAVEVHVASLRSKLGPAGRCLESVRGVGYRFTL